MSRAQLERPHKTPPRLMCHDCLQGLANSLRLLLNADICAFFSLEADYLSPIVAAGVETSEFEDIALQRYILGQSPECTGSIPESKFLTKTSATDSSLQFFQAHGHAKQALLAGNVDRVTRVLIAFFFKEEIEDIEGHRLDQIIECVRNFKNAFNIVRRQVYSPSEACSDGMDDIIGHSLPMEKIFNVIRDVAKSEASVLIVGETGTGKELIARSIHRRSQRNEGRFIAIDCVSIPQSLIESELFGFEKGSFTGAVSRKLGLLEFAHKGTLFLDEVSELDLITQSKLLRVLQERQFRRIGGSELLDVDIRVIAAMNVPPQKAILEGRLREDLFYRLNVIPIQVPPLRARKEDIPPLIYHHLDKTTRRNHIPPKQISKEAMKLLINYRWTGNIRQLQNLTERLALLIHKPVIEVDDLPSIIRNVEENLESIYARSLNEARKQYLKKFESRYLAHVLKQSNYDVSKAAKVAGVSPRTIYRMMEKQRRR